MLCKPLLSYCVLPGVILSQGSSSTMKMQFVLLLSAVTLATVQSDDGTQVRNVFDLGVPDTCLPGLHRKVSSLLIFFVCFCGREFGVGRVFPKLVTTQSCQLWQPLLFFCFLYYVYYGLWWKELICHDRSKYIKIKLNLKQNNARSANIANFVQLTEN